MDPTEIAFAALPAMLEDWVTPSPDGGAARFP